MFKNYNFRHLNLKLILFTITLAVIGVMAVGSADESLQNRQMWGVVAGVFLMLLLTFFDYRVILKLSPIIYIGSLVMLTLVLINGIRGGGAQRWINIFGVQFQPSELAKIALVISLAAFIGRFEEELNTFKVIIACVAIFAIPAFMIFKQPDLSTTIAFSMIFVTIMFVSDTSWKVIIGTIAVAIPVFVICLYLIMQPDTKIKIVSDYQKSRIMSFFSTEDNSNDEGYQQTYSVMAIGSGQLTGKGYRNNEIYSVKNADFIAEQQTDFIFAVIGEEFGFIGTCTVIVLIFLICLECFRIAHRSASLSGRIIGAGVAAQLGFQSFINIGVVTYLLPNTGLPLPFVSYGLTSLIASFLGIGLVLNVGLQCKDK